VESEGNDEVRLRRKELVRNVEKKLAELDEAVEAQRREWRAAAVPVSEVNTDGTDVSIDVNAPSQQDVDLIDDKMDAKDKAQIEAPLPAIEQQSTSAVANADTDVVDISIQTCADEYTPAQNLVVTESTFEIVANFDHGLFSLPQHGHELKPEESVIQSPDITIESAEDKMPPSPDAPLSIPEGAASTSEVITSDMSLNLIASADTASDPIPTLDTPAHFSHPASADSERSSDEAAAVESHATVEDIDSQSRLDRMSDIASDSSSDLGDPFSIEDDVHDATSLMNSDYRVPCVDPKVAGGWLDVDIKSPLVASS
jgi:hypothetical protein